MARGVAESLSPRGGDARSLRETRRRKSSCAEFKCSDVTWREVATWSRRDGECRAVPGAVSNSDVKWEVDTSGRVEPCCVGRVVVEGPPCFFFFFFFFFYANIGCVLALGSENEKE